MKTTFSPRDVPPRPEERQFPMTVEHKGSKVTILETPNRGKSSFTIIYYAEGQRQRFTRREFESAFEQGQEVASELGAGGFDVLPLSGTDRRVYERALDLLRPLGLRLDEVAAEDVELRKRLNGSGTPTEAADHFVRNRPKASPSFTVRAVVDEFIESRKKEEVGKLYLRDIRLRLGDFSDAFNCPIGTATPAAIDRYLDALPVAKRTRYNYRGNVGTLMNFATERGYLPHDFPGLLKVGKRKRFPRRVQVFTPEEMGKLLHGAKPDVALPLDIWGGTTNTFGTRYNPRNDAWTPMAVGPAMRAGGSAVWTGTNMLLYLPALPVAGSIPELWQYQPPVKAYRYLKL